ncbi:hypothetical protein JTE90_013698 [Oedothorax gibbosus]|uniref:Ig-like domain-containing protein n=1 Tax=Oedothorax gibbosus TaxID=931172 RepID=A0AAV6UIH2_9ARAC|nr:hypothetical protein JTE90_013698 [Oedothorax gibbosus]
MNFKIIVPSCLLHIIFLVILKDFSCKAFELGKVGNYAVLRGSTLILQCIPRVDVQTRRQLTPDVASVWTDADGRELVDSRYTRRQSGALEIVNAHVGDSGVLKCKVRTPGGEVSKVYEHKLIVYELAGHKFVTTVLVDLSNYGMDIVLAILNDLVATACGRDLCSPGVVRAKECGESEKVQRYCEFSIVYEGINQIADEICNEDCVRQNMFRKLKKAENILVSDFMRMADIPTSRLKPDTQTIQTKHLVTCRAGFHLVKAFFKRCFPCIPGYYSKQNSAQCSLCNIGYYQDKYGRHDCEKCDENKSTETMGAKSKDECVDSEKTGILGNIKEGFASLFSG